MTVIVQEVNVLALGQAAEALVGTEVTNSVMRLYALIDRAMKDGYELGKMEAEANVEERIDAAFDNGFDEGFDQGYDEGETDGMDEGYLSGVANARVNPKLADITVENILAKREQDEVDSDNCDDGYYWGHDGYKYPLDDFPGVRG